MLQDFQTCVTVAILRGSMWYSQWLKTNILPTKCISYFLVLWPKLSSVLWPAPYKSMGETPTVLVCQFFFQCTHNMFLYLMTEDSDDVFVQWPPQHAFQVNPRAAGGGIKLPPFTCFVIYLRNLMSYERETWHSFKWIHRQCLKKSLVIVALWLTS